MPRWNVATDGGLLSRAHGWSPRSREMPWPTSSAQRRRTCSRRSGSRTRSRRRGRTAQIRGGWTVPRPGDAAVEHGSVRRPTTPPTTSRCGCRTRPATELNLAAFRGQPFTLRARTAEGLRQAALLRHDAPTAPAAAPFTLRVHRRHDGDGRPSTSRTGAATRHAAAHIAIGPLHAAATRTSGGMDGAQCAIFHSPGARSRPRTRARRSSASRCRRAPTTTRRATRRPT